MRHIEIKPWTLRYTYSNSYTLIYTLHIGYAQNNRLLHKRYKRIIQDIVNITYKQNKVPTLTPVTP